MTRIALVSTIAILALVPCQAEACSCLSHDSDPSKAVHRSLDFADAVLIGTVVATELPEFSAVGIRGFIQTTTFSVSRVWKGEVGPSFVTQINITGGLCGFRFGIGETYLVFARRRENGTYEVSICSLTAPLEQSEKYISALGDVAESQ